MATAGPRYPGTTSSETGPSGDNDWLSTSPIGADDGSEAQITAATFDAADHSFRLIASNFGFDADIAAGSTINGITVEIDRRCFAGAAQDQEVRLYDSSATLVGDDKQTATAWPATLTVATYGSSSDTWSAGLDADDIRSANFGVALIVLADGANTDIGVDFIRVTIDYTAPVLAEVATGTGAALAAAAIIAVSSALSSGTGTAYDATVQTGVTASAEVSGGTGTANAISAAVDLSGGLSSGTGAANLPSTSVSVNGGSTTGSGTAHDAAADVGVPGSSANAELAAGTGSANASAPSVAGSSSAATGTGASETPTSEVAVNGGIATGSGTAPDASVGGGAAEVMPDAAAGAGVAYNATATGGSDNPSSLVDELVLVGAIVDTPTVRGTIA